MKNTSYSKYIGELFLLTWINFNPSLDNKLQPIYSVGQNALPIPKFERRNRWSLGID